MNSFATIACNWPHTVLLLCDHAEQSMDLMAARTQQAVSIQISHVKQMAEDICEPDHSLAFYKHQLIPLWYILLPCIFFSLSLTFLLLQLLTNCLQLSHLPLDCLKFPKQTLQSNTIFRGVQWGRGLHSPKGGLQRY